MEAVLHSPSAPGSVSPIHLRLFRGLRKPKFPAGATLGTLGNMNTGLHSHLRLALADQSPSASVLSLQALLPTLQPAVLCFHP